MIILLPIYLTILTITVFVLIRSRKKSIGNAFSNDDESSEWMILFGALFTSIAPLIGFLRFDAYGPDMPFSKQHVTIIELLVIVSAICYWISKLAKKKLHPLANLFLRAGLIQGIILDVIITIHFANYMGLGLMFPFFGFELLAPPMAMLFLLYELECNFKSPKQIPDPVNFTGKKFPLQLGAVMTLIFVQQALLLPMGSQWDSLVLAFTESRGFIFSSGFNWNG
jgi:hypothetical protein